MESKGKACRNRQAFFLVFCEQYAYALCCSHITQTKERMEKTREEMIMDLKQGLYNGIPEGVFSTPEQELVVMGLLFDAVDDALQLAEKMKG